MPPWPRFQLPPRQTQRADFPHGAFLLAAHQELWDRSGWERFRHLSWALYPGVLAQAQAVIPPRPPPPLPAEAPLFPCTPQMTPDCLFHPIFDNTTTPTGIADSNVSDPASQDRVDQRHHPSERLGGIPPKHLLQLPPQGCPLLQQRRIPRPPSASSASHPPAVKPSAAHMLPTGEVDHPAFFLMDGPLEGRGWPWPVARLHGVLPGCRSGPTGPRNARTVPPSPGRLSSGAGLAA